MQEPAAPASRADDNRNESAVTRVNSVDPTAYRSRSLGRSTQPPRSIWKVTAIQACVHRVSALGGLNWRPAIGRRAATVDDWDAATLGPPGRTMYPPRLEVNPATLTNRAPVLLTAVALIRVARSPLGVWSGTIAVEVLPGSMPATAALIPWGAEAAYESSGGSA